MKSVRETINHYKLIKTGDVVGVAVSGGSDSMAMLHILNELSQELDFEIVAIHINHKIREESENEEEFVMGYCKQNHIRAYKFRIDVPRLAQQQNKSLETAARDARRDVFKSLIQKGIVDKVAIAHHMSDQAETVLLHLFRGSGLAGAKGMEIEKEGTFIRPLLETSKQDIMTYILDKDIPYVQDSSNEDSAFSRNYIRNEILPLILKKWPNAIGSLNSFAKACTEDDEYLNSLVFLDALIIEDKTAKIPNTYFLNPSAIVSRIIFKALKQIDVKQDIEKKHIEMIKQLAIEGENGSKINLPNSIVIHKEYDYITIVNKYKEPAQLDMDFKTGEFDLPSIGKLTIKRVKKFNNPSALYIDSKKLPKDAKWRLKENGDLFEKFGGGTKKLKDFLIDKKVPVRMRSSLPVLAVGNEILVIAGVEISEKLRLDNETTGAYMITFDQEK